MRDAANLPQVTDRDEAPDLPAGDFSAWLLQTRTALSTGTGVDVPCGDCTACCTASYFIHIAPGETQTLARIKRQLLFPAPGLPKGNKVLGYDQHGHCPMLRDNQCTIYAQRPHTCRAYDCRIFAATGTTAGDADKAQINQRIQRWQFRYPTPQDRAEHAAVQAAAAFLRDHAESLPPEIAPQTPSQLAILAIQVYDVFLASTTDLNQPKHVAPPNEIAQAVIAAHAQFENASLHGLGGSS